MLYLKGNVINVIEYYLHFNALWRIKCSRCSLYQFFPLLHNASFIDFHLKLMKKKYIIVGLDFEASLLELETSFARTSPSRACLKRAKVRTQAWILSKNWTWARTWTQVEWVELGWWSAHSNEKNFNLEQTILFVPKNMSLKHIKIMKKLNINMCVTSSTSLNMSLSLGSPKMSQALYGLGSTRIQP